jgi:hypothetical protein
MRVHATYNWDGSFAFDDIARTAAGRDCSYSGCGFGERDIGWTGLSEIEAEGLARRLRKAGLTAEIRPDPE